MNIGQWQRQSAASLSAASKTPQLDIRVLLKHALGLSDLQLIQAQELELGSTQLEQLETNLKRLELHEPIAYITGVKEFYGREFKVASGVLIPRPESEAMITAGLELARQLEGKPMIELADLGCGSGALGITLVLELVQRGQRPRAELIDNSPEAIDLAKQNARTLKATPITDITLGDITTTKLSADITLANLPYVPNKHEINEPAKHEPAAAIFSGPKGLDHYAALAQMIKDNQIKTEFLVIEHLPAQYNDLLEIFTSAGLELDHRHSELVTSYRQAALE